MQVKKGLLIGALLVVIVCISFGISYWTLQPSDTLRWIATIFITAVLTIIGIVLGYVWFLRNVFIPTSD